MEFRILGALEVQCGHDVLALGGAKPRVVLAVLLLHANEPVRAERLAIALWGDEANSRAVKTVQVHVSRLRKALGGGDVLATTPAGYRLRVRPGELDSERFDDLVKTGLEALAAGQPEVAAAVLREALDLWRGPPLAELAFEPFAQVEIARLEEKRLTALEARAEADLAAGRHAQLIAELQQLAAANPTRERLAGQLVLALYRCGRQADALAVYRNTRKLLVEKLGIEPGRELRALEQKVLKHDSALELVRATAVAPNPALSPPLVRMPMAPPKRRGRQNGAALPASAVEASDPPVAAPLVRKTVTVLVASLRDSGRSRHADPEVMRRLMKRGREEAGRIVVGHGGVFHRGLGAELVGVFGLSITHEDDALRALSAAIDLREGMDALLDGEPGGLHLHVGLDTGELVADGVAEDISLFGEPLDGAVALARTAQDGQILLSEATRQLAPDAIRVEPVDAMTWLLGEIIATAADVRRRHPTPMIGRDDELAVALAALGRATKTRSAELLIVVGEAGIGKSRLVEEFRQRVDPSATTLVAYCGGYGNGSSLWPLRDAIVELSGGGSRDAIRRVLGEANDADAVADLVTAGLGIGEPVADNERIPWALRRLLETVAERGPLVLIVEDVHSAEPPLLDLLEYLIEWLTTAPVFVLCLARPEFLDERGGWISGRTGVSALRLSKLEPDAASLMLDNLIDERSISVARREDVLQAAEGNPFFIEQFAMRSEDAGSDSERRVPATIHALLAARLDRLGHGERALIKRAAVIGRRFTAGAAIELLPANARPAAARHLRELVHRGLITPDRSPVPGEDMMRFHHILIRDVAYAASAKEERRRVHEDFANSLARRGESADEAVGYHLEQAFSYHSELERIDSEARELATRAADRLEAAGRRALARGDASAASRLLRRAANLFEAAGHLRPDVLLALGSALCDSGDWPAAGPVLRSALIAAREADEPVLVARTMVELSHQRLFADPQTELDAMRKTADEAITIFTRWDDRSGLARAWNHIGFLHWGRLDVAMVEEALERSLEHAERAGDTRERAEAFNTLLRATVVGPCPVDVGLRRCETIREAAGDGVSLAAATDLTQAVLEAMSVRIDVARDLYQGARGLLEELGLGLKLAGLEIYAAMVELIAGDPGIVEPGLERACADLKRVGERGRLPTAVAFLARTRYAQGRLLDALRLTYVSEELCNRHDLASVILWSGTRGRVLARRGKAFEAERLARLSVTLAQRASAVYLTAEALTDLADVLAALDRPRDAARALDQAIALHEAKRNEASARSARAVRNSLPI